MSKTKPLITLGRRDFQVLNYADNKTWSQIDTDLKLNGSTTYSKKLKELGLLIKVKKLYKITDNGKWFIKYIYDNPKILEKLKGTMM